jgi:hypothetical protein
VPLSTYLQIYKAARRDALVMHISDIWLLETPQNHMIDTFSYRGDSSSIRRCARAHGGWILQRRIESVEMDDNLSLLMYRLNSLIAERARWLERG